jgi:chromosome segregation ATPase
MSESWADSVPGENDLQVVEPQLEQPQPQSQSQSQSQLEQVVPQLEQPQPQSQSQSQLEQVVPQLEQESQLESQVESVNYTSKKFGMNRFQKVNLELSAKVNILEDKYNKKSCELETLKIIHNKVILEKSQKSIQLDQTTQEYSQELNDIESMKKRNLQEYNNLEKEFVECKEKVRGLTNELAAKMHEAELKNNEIGESSTRYSQLKQKYVKMEELYNSKVANCNSTDVTISELSNQITLKTAQFEKMKQETLELRKSTQDYREQNCNYRKYLDDKDKFISSLNATIDDYTFQLENGLTKKSEDQVSNRISTPRVVTLSEPVKLSIQSAPRSGNRTGRGVPSTRNI